VDIVEVVEERGGGGRSLFVSEVVYVLEVLYVLTEPSQSLLERFEVLP
jgi:hypothetical protein